MPFLKSYYETLYRCPLVRLTGYAAACKLAGPLYAYLDFGGATGTAKDALAEAMLALAAEKGRLVKAQPVLVFGAGSFAAAMTVAAGAAGHPVLVVLPDDVPFVRQAALERLGAKLLFSPAGKGLAGARKLAGQTAQERGLYLFDPYSDDDNPEFHRRVTGPAIVRAIRGETASVVDAVVAGVGTGGTVTGVGETVKAWTNDVRIVAVEPYECQAIGGRFLGAHQIPGLGCGFVPENYNPYVVDNVAAVTSADAQRAALEVLRTDGIPADVSAGAALFAARQLLESGTCRAALCLFGGRQSVLPLDSLYP